MSSNLRDHGIAIAAIVLAVVIIFHGLLAGNVIATNDLGGNDLLYYHLPMGTLFGQALRSGYLLQWTPYMYSGFPVFAEGQGGYLYPPNILLWGLLEPVAAMNAYILLHAVLMGVGVYAFSYRLTKNVWASLPAGVVGAVCGSVIAGHTRHLNVLAIVALMPWLLWVAEGFVNRGRMAYAGLFGVLLAMMVLAGHPPHAFMAACYGGVYILLRQYLPWGRAGQGMGLVKWWQTPVFFLAAGIVALLISLPQVLATQELAEFSRRVNDPAAINPAMGSMSWDGFVSLIWPYFHGNIGNATFREREVYMFWENFFYVGAVITGLAVWGGIRYRRVSNVGLSFLVMIVLSYLLALGDHFFLFRLLSHVPVIGSFRFPIRWFLIAEIAVLTTSAYGVAALGQVILKKFKSKKNTPQKTLARYALILPGIICAVAAFLEIAIVAGRQVVTDPPEGYLQPSAFAAAVQQARTFGRMMSVGTDQVYSAAFTVHKGWEQSRDLYKMATTLIPPNLSAVFHIPAVDSYNSLVPNYVYSIWGDSHGMGAFAPEMPLDQQGGTMNPSPTALKLLRMWGVRFFPSFAQYPAPFTKAWDTADAAGRTLQAYELPETFPRAWVVGQAITVPAQNIAAAVQTIVKPGFDPAVQAVVSDTAFRMPPDAANGTAQVLKAGNHSITLRADVPGLVVLSDTWYPRWKARADGNDVPVYRVNGSMRGVLAPHAGSVITMTYDSGGLILYCGVGIIVLLLALFYAWRGLKPERSSIQQGAPAHNP